MTKQEILERFRDINEAYNDSSRFDSLSRMLDELLKEQEAVVRCKDCKHKPISPNGEEYDTGFDLEFPDNVCPCKNSDDGWYSYVPPDNWFCPNGEAKQ